MGRLDTGHTQASRSRSPRVRDPRVVTYRYKERMVYVTPADTYEVSGLGFCHTHRPQIRDHTASCRVCKERISGRIAPHTRAATFPHRPVKYASGKTDSTYLPYGMEGGIKQPCHI